ncbi:MAG: AAA family ATPase [Deltaproteobacteria bacterium]|nr:AAA family ATPase [Deltaproteobacteria bacterium]
MITALTVSNFRSLGENVTLRLGRLTVLVGQNGSGKSNVINALRFVADAMQMGLSGALTQHNGIAAVRRWSRGHPYNVAFDLSLALADGHARYSFELVGDSAQEYRVKSERADILSGTARFSIRVERGTWAEGPENLRPPIDDRNLALPLVGGDVRFRPLLEGLRGVAVYSIFPDTLGTPQAYSPARPMDRHGRNWASVLRDQPEETWKAELLAAMRKLSGDFEDVMIQPAANLLVVRFRHASPERKPKWFDAGQESDGTLRVAGIVTALLQEPPVPVIGIEEPELTVHPGAIGLLYDHLVQASKRSQVVVTTHSPDLLDLVSEDDVRVVARVVDGCTTVAPLAHAQRDAVRSRLMTLGDVLRTEGLQQEMSFPPQD